jgi:hypothetical protein
MNDGGSIRIAAGNSVFTAAGNKILNNKIHDVSDSTGIGDSNGYGGDGIYMDSQTGLVDVENNLVYRVSDSAIYTPHGPSPAAQTLAGTNIANTIKNNILAYARKSMVTINWPYFNGFPPNATQSFVVSNNLFYFDRFPNSMPKFWVQGGCTFPGTTNTLLTGTLVPYTQFQQFTSNLYWNTDTTFATDKKTFYVQPIGITTGQTPPCDRMAADWIYYTFPTWQSAIGEDAQSIATKDPGFANPTSTATLTYPADDYALPNGTPGVGFVVFDPSLAGRSNPVLAAPTIPATFATQPFNAATDF